MRVPFDERGSGTAVLFLHAGIADERGAREIAELVADAEFELIPGAGHLAPLEAPEQFRGLLRGFLGRLP